MPYNTAYGTRLGLSEHNEDMYGVRKAKSRTNRSSGMIQRAASVDARHPWRGQKVFRLRDFAFKPQRSGDSSSQLMHSRRPRDDPILPPIPSDSSRYRHAERERVSRPKVPPWLVATCRMLSDSHPLRKIAPPSPPTSKRTSDHDVYSPVASLRPPHADNAAILKNQRWLSVRHASEWNEERNHTHTPPSPSDHSLLEGSIVPRSSTSPLKPGSRPSYSHRCNTTDLNEPVFACSRISYSPAQDTSAMLPPSPIIDSTVTLVHPLAKRLSAFPAFDQQVSISATPTLRNANDFSLECSIPWDTNRREFVAPCSDPVSDAVRTTQSFITPAIGASISFPSRPASLHSLGLHLDENGLPAGLQTPIENFIDITAPLSLHPQFNIVPPATPLSFSTNPTKSAAPWAKDGFSPSVLPTPRKSLDRDVYHENLVNFAADSLKYSPLPSLMVGIERGMKRRIESSQETVSDQSNHTNDHGTVPRQTYVDGLSAHELPALPSGSAISSSTWKNDQGIKPTDPVTPQRGFVRQSFNLRPHIHSSPYGTHRSTNSNSRKALPRPSASLVHHLPAQSMRRPKPFVPTILVQHDLQDVPDGTKPEPQSLPVPKELVQTVTPSDSHRNLSAWSLMLRSSEVAFGSGVHGDVDSQDPEPLMRAQNEQQQSQNSHDSIESWSVEEDVLGFLKGKWASSDHYATS